MKIKTRVRISVKDLADLAERYGPAFAEGNIYVSDPAPPPVGNTVSIEFVTARGEVLCQITGRVEHARHAIALSETTAGMDLKLTQLDATARELAASQAPKASAEETSTRMGVESFASLERPPLISLDGPVVGIDLGTVNSCVASFKGDRPYVITSPHGYQTVPSVVFVPPEGAPLVGHRAVEKMILTPGRSIYGSKRFLGRPFASKEVHTLGHFFSYELTEGKTGRVAARIGDKVIPLEEVSRDILRALKEMAEDALGVEVKRAVVTVPAYFGETQRQAVRDAARLAGLYVERILNEPTAAAVAYGWGRDLLGTVLVYDLGGGTFDVAILRVDGERVEVIATDGDPFLGGSDFDDRLTEFALMRFERTTGINLRSDLVAVQRIRFAAEQAKRELSEATASEIYLPYICNSPKGFLDLRIKIDRDTLESLTQDLVERTFMLMQKVLDAAKITSAQLDDIILVGGQSRSPHVRRLLAERFSRNPSASVHPDEAVAMGAAIIAHAFEEKRAISLVDVLPASIRLAHPDGSTTVLLPRGTRLPATSEVMVAPEKANENEYRVTLCRGEAPHQADNTPIGMVRLPGSLALALAGTKAPATVTVNAEGILSVTIRHPLSGQSQDMEVSLLTQQDLAIAAHAAARV